MGDHLVLYVDRLERPGAVQPAQEAESGESSRQGGSSIQSTGTSDIMADNDDNERRIRDNLDSDNEEGPLLRTAECRICQEEDRINDLEAPCGCSGSLKDNIGRDTNLLGIQLSFLYGDLAREIMERADTKINLIHDYAHRKCVQHWCNEKGNTTCEICHQCYQSGYTAPPSPPQSDNTAIDISGGWAIAGTSLDLRDPHLMAIADAERRFLEAEYDEYTASNATGAAFCRSAALILMAVLLLRHAMSVTDADGDDDTSALISIFFLRIAGFLLPCYIMAWAISILQQRRQRQEAAAMAATQVALVLQSGQNRGLHLAIAPGAPASP